MQNTNNILTNNNLIIPSIVLALGFFLFGFVLKSGFDNFSNKTDTITVTGSTERIVISDLAKWNLSLNEKVFGAEEAGREANKKVEIAFKSIENYLTKNGIDKSKMVTSAAVISPICEIGPQGYENCAIGTRGQIATKNIIIESENINLIKNLSDKIMLEIANVNITNNNVEYLYNNLKNIRAEMLSEATKNAKERADAVARAGGARIGKIISLSSGVFQVTGKNSIEIDSYGYYDTNSIEKKITATVKANFSVK